MASILSEEGVTQGDVLAMILYGLALIPITKELKKNYLNGTREGVNMNKKINLILPLILVEDELSPVDNGKTLTSITRITAIGKRNEHSLLLQDLVGNKWM